MKKIIQFITTTLLVMITMAVHAETLPADVVKQTVTAFMKKQQVPGVAVEMYVDGKPYAYYFGYANREKKIPVSQNTIFELGSISKVLTGILLAQQIDCAKMSADDSIKTYLAKLPDDYADIQLKHLATHTSGLPMNVPSNIKSQPELYGYLNEFYTNDEAGENWTYSNVGVGLLGYALEIALHKKLDQLYRSNILQPLKMQLIGTTVPKKLLNDYAQGYDKVGGMVAHNQTWLFPAAGAVKASANDMQRFLSAAIGLPGTPESLLYPIRLTQSSFVKLPNKTQGLGWVIHQVTAENKQELLSAQNVVNHDSIKVEEVYKRPIYNGDNLIDKTGATDGFKTYMAVIPNKQSGIVVMVNKDVPSNEVVQVGREILFRVTDDKLDDGDVQ